MTPFLSKNRCSYVLGLLSLFSSFIVTAQNNNRNANGLFESVERNSFDNSISTIHIKDNTIWSVDNASQFVNENITNGDPRVKFIKSNATTSKQGLTTLHFDQYIDGLKVERANYKILTNRNGYLSFVNGNAYTNPPVTSATPAISEVMAREIATNLFDHAKFAWEVPQMEQQLKAEQNNPTATYFPKAELVWVEDKMNNNNDRSLRLAYKFNVYSIEPLARENVYVDANDGHILYRKSLIHHTDGSGPSLYSGTVNFKTSIISGTNRLRDSTRGSGVNTFTCNNTTTTVADVTSATTTWASDVALDAHWGAAKVYDYFLSEHSRNSFNNAGAAINSYVHYSVNYNNAFWNGSQMVYGDGSGIASGGFSPLASLDVCAHEIGHAVCQYTADLDYEREPGALNEGFSDIWGAIVEQYGNPFETDARAKNMWHIGEEIGSSPLRRMDNPNSRSQPDTYTGTFWINVVGCTPTSSNDYCGVHYNSGVLNHWFYLLCQGGSGTNDLGNAFSVSAIGTSKGADIAYQTELALTNSSTFANCRTASIAAATALYGACSPEVEAVTRAWYAVGVGANYTGGSVSAISGSSTVCAGSTTTYTNASTGGTWSSSNSTVATIGSSTGIITGIASGTSNITYTVSGGCFAVKTITVNASPNAGTLSGASSICIGSTGTITTSGSGGTYSSSSSSVATVGSTTGIVSGISAGTAIITYSVSSSCGTSNATRTITIVATPAAIGGTATVCVGNTTTLTNSVSSGSWSSSNTSVASIGSSTGIVNGVSAGTATISYTIAGACRTTKIVTVSTNSGAGTLSGVTNLCAGSTGTITSTISGGSWSSSNAAIASVGTSGVVTAVSSGTCIITYTVINSCGTNLATRTITVNPTPATISGASSLCAGNTTSLSNSVSGGTWSSSNNAIAVVGTSGTVTGISSGTVIISYILSGGCFTTKTLTVTPSSSAGTISGATGICIGGTSAFSSSVSGGTWSSSNASIATIGSSTGTLLGVAAGTSTISYTVTNSCGTYTSSTVVSVNATPDAISGSSSVCVGSTATFTNGATGGTWSSSNTSIATVSATGTVTGIAAGSAIITYSLPGSCFTTKSVTVSSSTGAGTITGTTTLCSGTSSSLSASISGGSWASSNSSVATVGSTGIISAISSGTAVISYSIITSCGIESTTLSITVNPTPSAISGTTTICPGNTSTLTNTVSGGTWSINDPTIATISSGGLVTGLASGSTLVTYTLVGGCYTTALINVISGAGITISGLSTTCVGGLSTLTSSEIGGSWYSSNPSIASIDNSTGEVTGISTGTTIISYVSGTGCSALDTFTVTPIFSYGSISGATQVCIGDVASVSHNIGDGTWSVANSSIATINPTSGVITGISAGNTIVSYINAYGCYDTSRLSVNTLPTTLYGSDQVCVGTSSTLVSSASGGTWSSSDASIASINGATGLLTGVTVGTATITYRIVGCYSTKNVTVNPVPDVISGPSTTCVGNTISLTNSTPSGTWSSSNTSIASVNTSGNVTGVSSGVVTISYILPSGCRVIKTISVVSTPATITGTTNICVAATSTLTNSSVGGTWSSANSAIASIDASTGLMTGNSAGTTLITYSIGGSCFRTVSVNVNAALPSISGALSRCVGQTSTLANTTTGGTWSSSNVSVVSINTTTGLANTLSVGTSTISYRTSVCTTTAILTVNVLPDAIIGSSTICNGTSQAFSHSVSGGTWSSSNTARININSTTGLATAITTGSANITYTLPSNCITVRTITVVALPASITGVAALCQTKTTTLTNTTTGGTWSVADGTIASIGSTSGIVTGISAGNTNVTYTLSTGCVSTRTVTVNSNPDPISGSLSVCSGSTNIYSSLPSGGTWTSSNTAVATINSSTGNLTGAIAGTANISYSLSNGCRSTAIVTVGAIPGNISGLSSICLGSLSTLSNSTSGGSWYSSNETVATISSGIVTSLSTGTSTISYTHPTSGCPKTLVVTVTSAVPSSTGSTSICIGQTSTLSNSMTGGNWISSSTTIASANATLGIITGISTGTVLITYRITNACYNLTTVNVNTSPSAITGLPSVCLGNITTLSHSTEGGTWTSSNTTKATVDIEGNVTGIGIGTSRITYSVDGCFTTVVVTVNSLPATISGSSTTTVGSTTLFSCATTGGAWSTSDASIATVGSTGIVSGLSAGTATISYILTSTGCANTKTITVNTTSSRPITSPEFFEEGVSTIIYPNPTYGTFYVESTSDATITVFSIDGKEIHNEKLSQGINHIDLPQNITSGIYLVKIIDAFGGVQSTRINILK